MNAVRGETTGEADGELQLTGLPCRRGDKVEAIVLILEQPSRPTGVVTRVTCSRRELPSS